MFQSHSAPMAAIINQPGARTRVNNCGRTNATTAATTTNTPAGLKASDVAR